MLRLLLEDDTKSLVSSVVYGCVVDACIPWYLSYTKKGTLLQKQHQTNYIRV